MNRISEGELDLYVTDDGMEVLQDSIEGCLVIAKPEFGAASYVAASGVGDIDKPIGRMVTKYDFQDVFNHIPDFEEPGWPVYITESDGGLKKWLVVVIDLWRPLVLLPGEAQATCIYTYPVVRDFVTLLRGLDCEELCYLGATAPNDSFPKNVFGQPKRSRTYEYHFGEGRKTTTKAFLLPPVWLFPYLFHAAGGKGWITFTGFREHKKDPVDYLAAETLGKYLSKTLNMSVDTKIMMNAADRIREEESEAKEMMEEVTKVMNPLLPKQPTGDDSMWG